MTLETAPMFRFTIRDVLWLTVVAGLALAWLDRERSWRASLGKTYQEVLERERRELRREMNDELDRRTKALSPATPKT